MTLIDKNQSIRDEIYHARLLHRLEEAELAPKGTADRISFAVSHAFPGTYRRVFDDAFINLAIEIADKHGDAPALERGLPTVDEKKNLVTAFQYLKDVLADHIAKPPKVVVPAAPAPRDIKKPRIFSWLVAQPSH